jgi:hypothetical protein
MIGPFPIAQVLGGVVGAFVGLVIGYRLLVPGQAGIGWLARQLRTLGALMFMGVGMTLGQLIGYLLHRLME